MISILIPLYNGIEYLDKTLMSVVIQTFKDWEVIIGVNGWPKDSPVFNQASLLSRLEPGKIRVLDLETKGKPATLNELVKLAKYDWISILDADDIWRPDKLEKQIPFTKSHDVIGTQCEYFGTMSGSPQIPLGNISLFDFFSQNPLINSSVILKKSLATWNPENTTVEDYELWLHLRYKRKANFYNLEDPLVLHRIHPASHFNNTNTNHVPQLLENMKSLYPVGPYVTCKMMGGYGNQLFILATTIAYCIKHNCRLVLPSSWEDKRPNYWNSALKNLALYLVNPDELASVPWNIVGELPDKSFYPLPSPQGPTMLFGYFQNPDYFIQYQDHIRSLLDNPHKSQKDLSNSLVIHVRRGDYLTIQDYHPVQPAQYYLEALGHFPQELPRIYVSEDKDWIRENLPLRDIDQILNEPTDILEFSAMTSAKNFIIANSSFSWWAAFMASSKKVVAPKNWFGKAAGQGEVCQIFPKDWIVI